MPCNKNTSILPYNEATDSVLKLYTASNIWHNFVKIIHKMIEKQPLIGIAASHRKKKAVSRLFFFKKKKTS